jgi:SAM-dependent methyltransferase
LQPATAGATATGDALEILSVALLDEHRQMVTELKALAAELDIGLGWHYLLDLSWIVARLPQSPGTVLDAGAGTGILQWYLAEQGWNVISVDRVSRRHLPDRIRNRYRVRGLRPQDLARPPKGRRALARRAMRGVQRLQSLLVALRHGYRPRIATPGGRPRRAAPAGSGDVLIYNQDLRSLADIADGSIHEVVAVSALEHNTPENLQVVVAELLRVLRPGGRLVATLVASNREDWYHEPSRAWCYSEATMRRIFGLDPSVTSNYEQYDRLLESLRANAELRTDLAAFYYRSGKNGMPWGKWDPQYQTLGVCKVKPGA